MITAEYRINQIIKLLMKAKGNDPQDHLDEERIEDLTAELESLKCAQQDYYDAKRKGEL
jgi:DNA-binding transcriptional regulator GbsR (MarR family)